MIKFEVSGATVEEFVENMFKAMGVRWTSAPAPLGMTGSPDATPPSPSEKPTVASDPVDDLFIEQQPAATVPKTPTSTHGTKKGAKGPKLDDLKARLSDVITAATDRGWDIKRANAYALKLLGDFRVAKLSELKPEYFEEFLEVSTMYTTGNADE